MTPYWQSDDGSHVLYNADCLDVLPTLAPGSVDAVVTDPPYGIAHPCNYRDRGRGPLAKANNYADVVGDNKRFDPSPFLSLNLPTVLWGGNWFADRLPASGGWLVWDKERPDTLDQATCELAWTNCVKGVRRFRHLWNGFMKASEIGESYHPTQKPVALIVWALSLKWLVGLQTILDPFTGSGTTGVACIRTGRRFIGVEISREYCDIAVRRMENELAQPFLPGIDPAKRETTQDLFAETTP